jgi:hypothetical protein
MINAEILTITLFTSLMIPMFLEMLKIIGGSLLDV